MQSDARLAEIRSRILPDINAATPKAQEACYPGIRNATLRQDIFAHPALGPLTMDELFSRFDSPQPEAQVPDDMLDALTFVLQGDTERIMTMTGLVWHANQLASLISSGAIAIDDTGWELADVRAALGLRAHSKAPAVAEQNFVDAIHSSGRTCLSAWLNTAPGSIKSALALSEGSLGEVFRDARTSPEQAQVTSVCLDRMRAAP